MAQPSPLVMARRRVRCGWVLALFGGEGTFRNEFYRAVGNPDNKVFPSLDDITNPMGSVAVHWC